MSLYIIAFAVILLPVAFMAGREYERNRWIEIDVRRGKKMSAGKCSRVEVRTKTGKVLSGEWRRGTFHEVVEGLDSWFERWGNIMVLQFPSETGTTISIPKESADYWEIREIIYEEEIREL